VTLTVELSERFREAADEWAEVRMMDEERAVETKAEQALLEVEHLVSGATEVEFEIEDGAIRFEPSDRLEAFLAAQSESTGLDEATVLGLHVDLFARVFLDDDSSRPPNAPPT